MSNRDQAPNSAFACIVEIKGKTHRLLRHHTADVQDGTEHDTVDVGLLKASLNLVDQLKDRGALSEEEYDEARAHLQSHARSIVVDPQPDNLTDSPTRRTKLTDEDAKKIVSQQAGGPSGNDSVTNPQSEATLDDTNRNQTRRAEEQLMQDGGKKGSITGKGSTATEPAEKSTENPAGVKGDIKHEVDKGPGGADVDVKKGKSTPADKPKVSETDEGRGEDPGQHVDNGEKLVGNPNADLQDDEPESSKGSKDDKADAASTPTKTGKEPAKKAKPELENDLTPGPKGAKAKKAKGEDDMEDKDDKAECELEKDKQPTPKGQKAGEYPEGDKKKKDGKKSKSEKNPLAQKKK